MSLIKKPQRFFGNRASFSASEIKEIPHWAALDIGNGSDALFRALAMTLVECFEKEQRKSSKVIEVFLQTHFLYFPQYRITIPGLVTPVDRMQHILRMFPLGELIDAFSYTLRQMVVSEMCHYPELYRDAFSQDRTPRDMRRLDTSLDDMAVFAALTKVMPIEIALSETTRLKSLPKRSYFGETGHSLLSVGIEIHHGRYHALLVNPQRFASLALIQTHSMPALNENVQEDPSLDEINAKLEIENKRIIQCFQEDYRRLAAMIAAGDLNLEQLLGLYSLLIDTCNNYNQERWAIDVPAPKHEAQDVLIHELVYALSLGMSLFPMSRDKILSVMDETTAYRSLASSGRQ